ncbi:YolD-like family protein [Bacillus inaquosorum]|nr:YolD-like family protein [Bacillus inaquosorum]
MLRDQGTIKWTLMMLPEHLTQLKQDLLDVSKIEKLSLDAQQIEEMDILVSEALEFNKDLVFNNGFVENVAAEYITLTLSNKSIQLKTRTTIQFIST